MSALVCEKPIAADVCPRCGDSGTFLAPSPLFNCQSSKSDMVVKDILYGGMVPHPKVKRDLSLPAWQMAIAVRTAKRKPHLFTPYGSLRCSFSTSHPCFPPSHRPAQFPSGESFEKDSRYS